MLDAVNTKNIEKTEESNLGRISVGGVEFGSGKTVVIAGPCSVESTEQIDLAARTVNRLGASILRGGAFKPRTSPHSFQGLGRQGLVMLRETGDKYGLPIVSEILSEDDVDFAADIVDMIQIGARNMQNFALLKKIGKTRKPVLLKRGPAATIEEWLSAADYLVAGGNGEVVLCERGIRGFDPLLRNNIDLGAVAWLKANTDFPVVVDPSHSTGIRELVTPVARAGIAVGADGIIVEVHPVPDEALSDAKQQLDFEGFKELIDQIQRPMPGIA